MDWNNRGSVVPDVLINGTSVGMHPNVDETPFDQSWLQPQTLVFDTVYNPEQTLLLRQAAEVGCATSSGLDMFVRQAARQFELFTGRNPPVDLMRETVRKALSG